MIRKNNDALSNSASSDQSVTVGVAVGAGVGIGVSVGAGVLVTSGVLVGSGVPVGVSVGTGVSVGRNGGVGVGSVARSPIMAMPRRFVVTFNSKLSTGEHGSSSPLTMSLICKVWLQMLTEPSMSIALCHSHPVDGL